MNVKDFNTISTGFPFDGALPLKSHRLICTGIGWVPTRGANAAGVVQDEISLDDCPVKPVTLSNETEPGVHV